MTGSNYPPPTNDTTMTPEQRKERCFQRRRWVTHQYNREGRTMRDIAEELGISTSRVGQILKAHGTAKIRPRGGYQKKLSLTIQ